MATPVTLGTAKTSWQVPVTGSQALMTDETVLEGAAVYSGFMSAAPTQDAPNGRFVLTLPTAAGDDQVTSVMSLGFFGRGTSGTKTLKARLWGVAATVAPGAETTGAWGVYLGELEITLGTKTYAGSGGQPPMTETGDYLFGDTINVVDDFSPTPPGFRLVGAGAGCFATLLFDTMGFGHVVVSLVIADNATKAGLAWRAF